jgi:hypothetical protein
MENTRGTPVVFYQALNRNFHMMGVNQKLFLLFIPCWVTLPLAWGFKPIIIVFSLMLFAVLHTIGILLTRADDKILEVYNVLIMRLFLLYMPS